MSRYVCQRKPFPSLIIRQTFGENLLYAAKHQLLSMEYQPKANDLYSHAGTQNLRNVDSQTPLGTIRDALYSSTFTDFLTKLTGAELDSSAPPGLSSHVYRTGDYLACHDDDIKDLKKGQADSLHSLPGGHRLG